MLNVVDNFLNSITMYRLILYYLCLLLIVGIIYSIFGILPFSPFYLTFSAFFMVAVCWVTNKLLSKIFKAPTNVESMYITALILALIVDPITGFSLNGILILTATGAIAMASKYILAINRKHVFNPAAISVVLTGILIHSYASWWVGTTYMFPFMLLGILIIRKLRRFTLFFTFLAVSTIVFLGISFLHGFTDIPAILNGAFINSPILFFACVMLVEPLTSPPTKLMQGIYGGIVGAIFGSQFHIGIFYTSLEMALVIGNIYSYIVSPKYKLILKLKEKTELEGGVYEFVFTTVQKIKFKAGQYLEWTIDPAKMDSRGNRRFFTISSSPTETDFKLGIKLPVDKPSTFKTEMLDMKKGREIVASQLSGEFTLPTDINQKLVFIAGGIGVTPFRSMIKYLIDMNEKRDIVLMYCEKTLKDFVYRDIFEEASKRIGIRVIYFETDVKGHMTSDILKAQVPDYMKRIFYLSGPHGMVVSFEKELAEINLPKKQIKVDYFPGF